MIGDPVNVAARVEAATREIGDTILLTEATRCLLERADCELEPRGAMELKGNPRVALQLAGRVIDEQLGGDFATVLLAIHDPRAARSPARGAGGRL